MPSQCTLPDDVLTSGADIVLLPFQHRLPAARRPRVLLGVTGSVAAIKLPELAGKLQRFADVRVVATPSAQHFFTETELPADCRPLLGELFCSSRRVASVFDLWQSVECKAPCKVCIQQLAGNQVHKVAAQATRTTGGTGGK